MGLRGRARPRVDREIILCLVLSSKSIPPSLEFDSELELDSAAAKSVVDCCDSAATSAANDVAAVTDSVDSSVIVVFSSVVESCDD